MPRSAGEKYALGSLDARSATRLLNASSDIALVLDDDGTILEVLAQGDDTAARVALGRMHLAAGEAPLALALARSAQADDAAAPGPVLLALDLLPGQPAAEGLVGSYIGRPDAEPAVLLAYVDTLTRSQRYGEAARQLERITRERPQLAQPWKS